MTPTQLAPTHGIVASIGACGRRRRCAFSLIELMIAIVILGLGLVMVGTVFPIAWGRARDLSHQTSKQAITEVAEATVKLLARVDGADIDAGSFAGDYLYDSVAELLITADDPRVHVLHMENLRVIDPDEFVWEEPWQLEDAGLWWVMVQPDLPGHPGDLPAGYFDSLYFWPQVRFEDRVYPALPARKGVDLMMTAGGGLYEYQGSRIINGPDDAWEAELEGRRFAWAVLHRLRTPIGTIMATDIEKARRVREFELYIATLRRPRANSRYARQDFAAAPDPWNLAPLAVDVAALPADEDVQFPVAWRVQVWFPGDYELPGMPPTGVPAEIEVPAPGASSASEFLIDMFPTGSWLIDEISGAVYRVERRRVTVNGDKAYLTLNREVYQDDLELGDDPLTPVNEAYGPCYGACDGVGLVAEERLRTVWVFPPPVDPARGANDMPVFNGRQPVVGIEVRSLSVYPTG